MSLLSICRPEKGEEGHQSGHSQHHYREADEGLHLVGGRRYHVIFAPFVLRVDVLYLAAFSIFCKSLVEMLDIHPPAEQNIGNVGRMSLVVQAGTSSWIRWPHKMSNKNGEARVAWHTHKRTIQGCV
jgi:hypothetical protein